MYRNSLMSTTAWNTQPAWAPEGVLSAQDEHDSPESAAAVGGILFGDEEDSAGQSVDQNQDDDAEAREAADQLKKSSEEEGKSQDENLTDEQKEAQEEEAKKAKEAEEDENDYIEVEVEGEEEPQRYSVTELWESHQRLQEAIQENQELKQRTDQIPEEVDQALKQTIETRQQLVESLQQWQNLAEPPEPNKALLDPDNPFENGGYDPQLFASQMEQRDNFRQAQATAKAELEKQQEALRQENAIRYTAVKNRATEEVKKFWPEMFNEDTREETRKSFTEGMVKHYGATEDEVKQLMDPRLFRMAKDALSFRASQKATEKVITKVRGKPKLIKNSARTNSIRKTSFDSAYKELAETNSDEAAIAALGALED